MSQAIGVDGISTAGGETGQTVNERFPTLDGLSQTRPHGPHSHRRVMVHASCVLALSLF